MHSGNPPRLFRIWLAQCGEWRPTHWQDVPARAKILELATEDCLPVEQATRFIEGFNATMLERQPCVWAVAIPVAIYYQGEPVIGTVLTPASISSGA